MDEVETCEQCRYFATATGGIMFCCCVDSDRFKRREYLKRNDSPCEHFDTLGRIPKNELKKLVDRFTEKTAHLVPSLEGARHEPIAPWKGERIRMVDEKWKKRAEKAETELAALKKDARDVAEFAIQQVHSIKLDEAACRILEATKED